MGHQHHRTPLSPPAELTIQELGGMRHRLAKVVGEREQRCIRPEQPISRNSSLRPRQPEPLNQSRPQVLITCHQLLKGNAVGADRLRRTQFLVDGQCCRVEDSGDPFRRVDVIYSAASRIGEHTPSDTRHQDHQRAQQGRGWGLRHRKPPRSGSQHRSIFHTQPVRDRAIRSRIHHKPAPNRSPGPRGPRSARLRRTR